MSDSSTPTLADVLPAPVRRVIYAVLTFAAAFAAVLVSALTDGFQWNDVPVLIAGLLTAAGFKLASSNTPR